MYNTNEGGLPLAACEITEKSKSRCTDWQAEKIITGFLKIKEAYFFVRGIALSDFIFNLWIMKKHTKH